MLPRRRQNASGSQPADEILTEGEDNSPQVAEEPLRDLNAELQVAREQLERLRKEAELT